MNIVSNENQHLDRLYSHYNNFEPIAILSVDTPDNTQQQNQENFAALTRHLFLAGFLYHRIQGEYTDRNKQTVEDTCTVIIYAYPDRQKELEKFTLSLGKAFHQQAVMLIGKSRQTRLISPQDDTPEQTLGSFHPEYIRQYFNKTGKKKYRIKALSEPKNYPERPKSWEMPAFEAYRKKLAQTEDIYTKWEKCTIQPKPDKLQNENRKDHPMKEHINRILYRYDLLMTGCKENPGMEDEYQDIAAELIRQIEENKHPQKQLEPVHLKKAFGQCFGEDILEDMGVPEKNIRQCVDEINKIRFTHSRSLRFCDTGNDMDEVVMISLEKDKTIKEEHMSEQAIDPILCARYCKLLDEHPDYTGKQLKTLFFETYGNQYTEEDYKRVAQYILDAYSKDI